MLVMRIQSAIRIFLQSCDNDDSRKLSLARDSDQRVHDYDDNKLVDDDGKDIPIPCYYCCVAYSCLPVAVDYHV